MSLELEMVMMVMLVMPGNTKAKTKTNKPIDPKGWLESTLEKILNELFSHVPIYKILIVFSSLQQTLSDLLSHFI